MSATAILLIVAIAFIFVLLAYIWWLHRELDSLSGSHARPRERGPVPALPDGAVPAGPSGATLRAAGAAPADPDDPSSWDDRLDALSTPGGVPPAQAADHADALWQASEPYLPPLPKRPTGLLARKVPVTRTAGAPPWETETAAQDAVTDEQLRAEYFAKPGRHELQQVRDELAGRFLA